MLVTARLERREGAHKTSERKFVGQIERGKIHRRIEKNKKTSYKIKYKITHKGKKGKTDTETRKDRDTEARRGW